MKRNLGKHWAVFVFVMAMGINACNGGSSSDNGDTGGSNPDDSDVPVQCALDPPGDGARTFYLDPDGGSNTNPGTQAQPLGSLQSVVEANMIETWEYDQLPYDGSNPLVVKNPDALIQAGDTLVLLEGYHGELVLTGAYNRATITVRAADGQRATLARLSIRSAANWHIQGLIISPSFAPAYATQTLAAIESHGWSGPVSKVILEACELFSVDLAASWSLDDWNTLACNGISVSGDCVTIRGNHLKNVDFGITISGNNCAVSQNIIENFAGDGMRGLGNDLLFAYNTVKNCYDVNANHDDGFQSWSINDDPPRERVVLRGNVILNYEDPDQPFRGSLQGIGCFDGPYRNWVVENNLVVVDHWHGISLYGAYDSRIVNNTVVDIDTATDPSPWVMFNPHKDGTPSQGCVIRNNLVSNSIVATGDTVYDHNLLVTDPSVLFENPADLNFHLRADALDAIDTGSSLLAPASDLEGTVRPQADGIDLGCYER